jgi:hypothetical protein
MGVATGVGTATLNGEAPVRGTPSVVAPDIDHGLPTVSGDAVGQGVVGAQGKPEGHDGGSDANAAGAGIAISISPSAATRRSDHARIAFAFMGFPPSTNHNGNAHVTL